MYEEKLQRPNTLALKEETQGDGAMLRAWQDKLKRRDSAANDIDTALAEIAKSGEDLQHLSRASNSTHRNSRLPVNQPAPVLAVSNTVLSPVMQESRPRDVPAVLIERAVPSRERCRSMIDPCQVKEALRLSNNPPSQVNQSISEISRLTEGVKADEADSSRESLEQESSTLRNRQNNHQTDISSSDKFSSSMAKHSPLFKSKFIPDINVSPTAQLTTGKVKEQELNDEGFEETQSLVSETLSQETSSGNYETDSTRCSPAELRYAGPKKSSSQTVKEKPQLRNPTAAFDKKLEKSSFLPKRSNSLKRDLSRKTTDVKRANPLTSNNTSRNEVERSGSRSSLRSSRSSLNSATSVNTVRNLAPNHAQLGSYTSAIRALTSNLRKGPTNSSILSSASKENDRRYTVNRTPSTRVPASRSSSSGSSVGPIIRNLRKAAPVRFQARRTIKKCKFPLIH